MSDFNTNHLIRLIRQYCLAVKCSCGDGTSCWRCVFQYNLDCLDHDNRSEAARDIIDLTIEEFKVELQRATIKFPLWPVDPIHAHYILGEESGELNKEILQLCYERKKGSIDRVRKEAVQTGAMAIRFLANFHNYEFNPGKQK